MKLILASIAAGRSRAKSNPTDTLMADYVARVARYAPCSTSAYSSESAFLASLEHYTGRTAPSVILLDRIGKQLASEEIAAHLGRLRDSGVQTVLLAIGPANGWSDAARSRAHLLLSFGPITLPHELARVVLAEQLYRALTILAGHPYHCSH